MNEKAHTIMRWYDRKWKYWKETGKRGLHLNSFGLKEFTQNLKAGIRELCIVENSFCDDILQKTNQLKECKLNRKMIAIKRKLRLS